MVEELRDQHPRIYTFIEEVVDRIFSSHDGWPLTILKLMLESCGIYQDLSGRVLSQVCRDRGLSKVEVDNKPYLVTGFTPTASGRMAEELEQARRFYDLVEDPTRSGTFPELLLFVALSAEVERAKSAGIGARSLPKGNYLNLLQHRGEVDAVLMLRSELFPVDVYNGTHHQMVSNKCSKWIEVHERSGVHPVLVNRLSSKRTKSEFLEMNSGVLDHQSIYVEDSVDELSREAVEYFNLDQMFEFLPPVEVDGLDDPVGAEDYDRLVGRSGTDGSPVLTAETVAGAEGQLPEDLLTRVRGLVRFLFVNQEYRRAGDGHGRVAALVKQRCYHHLLRSTTPVSEDDLVMQGWDRFREDYPRLGEWAENQQDAHQQEALEYLDSLAELGLTQKENGGYETRDATHPMRTLDFP